MVNGTKETPYQRYWIGYTEIFLGKEGWRLDCFVLSLVVLNFNEAIDVAAWETPTQSEMDTRKVELKV